MPPKKTVPKKAVSTEHVLCNAAVDEYVAILADCTGVVLPTLAGYIALFNSKFKETFEAVCLQQKRSYKSLFVTRMATRLYPDAIRRTAGPEVPNTRSDPKHVYALKQVADHFCKHTSEMTQNLPEDEPKFRQACAEEFLADFSNVLQTAPLEDDVHPNSGALNSSACFVTREESADGSRDQTANDARVSGGEAPQDAIAKTSAISEEEFRRLASERGLLFCGSPKIVRNVPPSKTPVEFKCSKCNESWKISYNNLKRRTGTRRIEQHLSSHDIIDSEGESGLDSCVFRGDKELLTLEQRTKLEQWCQTLKDKKALKAKKQEVRKAKNKDYMVSRREDSAIRKKEQEVETPRKQAKRKNKAYRKREQEKDTRERKTKREKEEVRREEQEKDTKKRKKKREKEEVRREEQEKDTKKRKTKREKEEVRREEQEKNTKKRKTKREKEEVRREEQEKDTRKRKKKREDEDIRKEEQTHNTKRRRAVRSNEERRKAENKAQKKRRKQARRVLATHRGEEFPLPITESEKLHCVKHYLETVMPEALRMYICAACGEQKHNAEFDKTGAWSVQDMLDVPSCPTTGKHPLFCDTLPVEQKCQDPRKPEEFLAELEGLVLEKAAVYADGDAVKMQVCQECARCLERGEVPEFALANGLWTGTLPPEFSDLTLPEQLLVSIARIRVYAFRLRSSFGPDGAQRAYKGNCIAFPQNVQNIAAVLPRPVEELAEMINVVFVGSGKPSKKQMEKIFKVRRSKVMSFLRWLKANNDVYKKINISEENAERLPEEDIPSVIWNTITEMPENEAEEAERDNYAADVPDHGDINDPIVAYSGSCDVDSKAISMETVQNQHFKALLETSLSEKMRRVLAQHTIYGDKDDPLHEEVEQQRNAAFEVDDECKDVLCNDPPAARLKSALTSSVRSEEARQPFIASRGKDPVVIVPRGKHPLSDFKDPKFFEKAYPLLFPYGRGGHHEAGCKRGRLSMDKWVKHLLLLHKSQFASHPDFMYVVFNFLQRRDVCCQARLQYRRPISGKKAKSLASATSKDFEAAIKCMDDGKAPPPEVSEKVRDLMNHLRIAGGQVKGSNFSRSKQKKQIMALHYFKGMSAIYLTINPSDVSNPLFLHYALPGSNEDFMKRIEEIKKLEEIKSGQQARMVAENPVAAAQFFDATMRRFFEVLLAYVSEADEEKYMKKHNGEKPPRGILGKVDAYYGTCEVSGRGSPHCHAVIWLRDCDWARVEEIFSKDSPLQKRFLQYVDSVVSECKPDVDQDFDSATKLKLTPETTMEDVRFHMSKKLPYIVQRCNMHSCRAGCHKYCTGDEKQCRFKFPRPIVEETHVHNGELRVKRNHKFVNSYNDAAIYCQQCNMDIQVTVDSSLQRGIVYYITDYITKRGLSSYSVYSLVHAALSKMEAESGNSAVDLREKSRLLAVKCLNKLAGESEKSAIEVCLYLLGFPEFYSSHATRFETLRLGAFLSHIRASFDSDEEDACEDVVISELNDAAIDKIDSQCLDYFKRATSLDEFCLYEFVMRCLKRDYPTNLNAGHHEFQEGHPHRHTKVHVLRSHASAKVPVWYFRDIPSDLNEPEDFATIALCLLKPWRDPKDLLESFDTWKDALDSYEKGLLKKLSLSDSIGVTDFEKNADSDLSDAQRHFLLQLKILCNLRECGRAMERAREDRKSRKEPGEEDDHSDEEQMDARDEEEFLYSDSEYGSDLMDEGDEQIVEDSITGDSEFSKQALQQAATAGWKIMSTMEGANDALGENIRAVKDTDCRLFGAWTKDIKAQQEAATAKFMETQANDKEHHFEPYLFDAENDDAIIFEAVQASDGAKGALTDDDIVAKFTLNAKQVEAFRLIAEAFHKADNMKECSQLRMFLTGAGGTGKTQVLNAMKFLFQQHGRLSELRCGAYMAFAACNIGGSTIHSLLGAKPGRKADMKMRIFLERLWRNVNFLFIDEVSMIGKELLWKLHVSICNARGSDLSVPFGGMHVILAGDFLQFPPICDPALYRGAYMESMNKPFYSSFKERSTERLQNVSNGRLLWKEFSTVVVLTEQMRTADPVYNGLLNRLRSNQCTDEDYQLLCTRVVGLPAVDISLPKFRKAPVIVARHETKTKLVNHGAKEFSEENATPLFRIRAMDMFKKRDTPKSIAAAISELPDTKTEGLPFELRLAIGMPVILRSNIASHLGLCNTASATVVGIILAEEDSQRKFQGGRLCDLNRLPKCVLVHVPGAKLRALDALKSNIVPIFPMKRSFIFRKKFPRGTYQVEVKREQFPLSAGYVKTAHGVQGATLPAAIVDLAIPSGGGGFSDTYVPLSRVKRLEDLAILRSFAQSVLQHRLDPDIVADHQRLGDSALPGASIDLAKYASCKRPAMQPRIAQVAICSSSVAATSGLDQPTLRSVIGETCHAKKRLFADSDTVEAAACVDPFFVPTILEASAHDIDSVKEKCKRRRTVDVVCHEDISLCRVPPAAHVLAEETSSLPAPLADSDGPQRKMLLASSLVQWGFENPGINICYANSLLRFLGDLLLPRFIGELPKRMPNNSPCVAHLLGRILTASAAPTQYVKRMAWAAMRFQRNAQQDAGDLLQRLVMRLNEECGQLLMQVPILQIVHDETGTTFCEGCQRTTITTHTNITGCIVPIIKIDDNREVTLRDIVDEAASLPDTLPDFECETCKVNDPTRRTKAQRTMTFAPRSQMQIYALPRVQELPDQTRRRGQWTFVPTEDIVAILCHQGQSFQSGHYFAFVRHPENSVIWRWYNDCDVTDGPLPDTALKQVYLVLSDRQLAHVEGSQPIT